MTHSAQEACVVCIKLAHGAGTAVCVLSRRVIASCASVLNAFKGGFRKSRVEILCLVDLYILLNFTQFTQLTRVGLSVKFIHL